MRDAAVLVLVTSPPANVLKDRVSFNSLQIKVEGRTARADAGFPAVYDCVWKLNGFLAAIWSDELERGRPSVSRLMGV